MSESLINKVLGRYRILKEIGKGGIGRVHLAEHIHTGKKVALKTLLTGWLSDLKPSERLEIEERFRREAQATAQISHDNIIQIYDFDAPQDDIPAYIVMEFLKGKTLHNILGQQDLISQDTAISFMLQICSGMAEAHSMGIIHRDLKPENIMVTQTAYGDLQERIKIIDFGIAKIFDPELTRITKHGQMIGTAKYMSPEQCNTDQGINIDERSDIYSMGLIFYEMLSNDFPFQGVDYQSWIICHLVNAPKPLPDKIPSEINNIVMKTLAKNPEERTKSVIEFREEIEKYKEDIKQRIKAEEKLNEKKKIQQLIDEEKKKLKNELTIGFEKEIQSLSKKIESFEIESEIRNKKHVSQIKESFKIIELYRNEINELELLLREIGEKSFRKITNLKLHDNFIITNKHEEVQDFDTDAMLEFADEFFENYEKEPVAKEVRIYDLARELKQDTKRIIEELRREGADVSVPSNSVSKELAEKVRNRYFPKQEAKPKRKIKVIKKVPKEVNPVRKVNKLEKKKKVENKEINEGEKVIPLKLTKEALDKGIRPGDRIIRPPEDED